MLTRCAVYLDEKSPEALQFGSLRKRGILGAGGLLLLTQIKSEHRAPTFQSLAFG